MLRVYDCVYVVAGMLMTVHSAPRILYMRAFAQYFAGKPSGLNIRNIICNAPRFQTLVGALDMTVVEDYAHANEYVRVFESVRMVYEHMHSWDPEKYAQIVGQDVRRCAAFGPVVIF